MTEEEVRVFNETLKPIMKEVLTRALMFNDEVNKVNKLIMNEVAGKNDSHGLISMYTGCQDGLVRLAVVTLRTYETLDKRNDFIMEGLEDNGE